MKNITVIGLGYVGLPLAIEFAKKHRVTGFDINTTRINELKQGKDSTLEVNTEDLQNPNLLFTDKELAIQSSDYIIVTVPTPITDSKSPDLTPLINASELIGRNLPQNCVVIFESTVYPGCTEEVCIPIIENESGKTLNTDFYCGYSPERINPGDKINTITNIIKVTSGSNEKALTLVDNLYKEIITAGTFPTQSIKTAEAAKVIENTQRDLNIALINELSIIFDKLKLDTNSVLEAAGTKWNFLNFRPGLVGGHCIGVDPYYLTYKSQLMGYFPELVLSGRRINESMPKFIASKLVKKLIEEDKSVKNTKILMLGLTFKENCPDLRNSKVFDLINELSEYGMEIDAFDPFIDPNTVNYHESNFKIIKKLTNNKYDAIVIAVAHNYFIEMGAGQLRKLGKIGSILFDMKGVFPLSESDLRI